MKQIDKLKSKNAINKILILLGYIIPGICFLIFTGTNVPVHAQAFDWALKLGGAHYDYARAVAVDGEGNIYVTGAFRESADFDPGSGSAMLTAMGTDIYLAKYDQMGKYMWAVGIGSGTRDNSGLGIAVDEANNVHITGCFSGTADFDPGPGVANLTSFMGRNVFVAKYDSNGHYVWAKHFEGISGKHEDAGTGIAVDVTGNVYLTGSFWVSADFDPGPGVTILNSMGLNDAFIAKLDRNGNYVWAGNFGFTANDVGYSIAVDQLCNLYVTGLFKGVVDFDMGTGMANLSGENGDMYIAKYDSSGRYIWAKGVGGKAVDVGYGMALDHSANIYVTGFFHDTVDFDPGVGNINLIGHKIIDSSLYGVLGMAFEIAASTIFFAKYDSAGNFSWAQKIEGSLGAEDRAVSAAVDKSGNLYITGFFTGTPDFDPGPAKVHLTNSNGYDLASFPAFVPGNPFIAKYSPEGKYLWAGSIENSHNAEGTGIAVDDHGNIYAVGSFHGTADFDPGIDTAILYTKRSANEVANGVSDGYIVKLACSDTTSYNYSVSTCQKSFTLNGEVYTVPGIYPQVFPNTLGCDSTIILDLSFYTIEPVITIKELVLGVNNTYSSYQWLKDGIAIPGATDSTYAVTENGYYQVLVTNENGCEGITPEYLVSNVPSAIQDANHVEQSISIHPNPSKDMVYISSANSVRAYLYSIDGRLLASLKDALSFSLKNWGNGIYLLKLTDQQGKMLCVQKIIKQ